MSNREEQFLTLWKRLGPTGYELARQYRFCDRRWRLDFAMVTHKIGIEIDGVVWFGGAKSRHQTARGLRGDHEKTNAATALGWKILRYTQQDLDQRPMDVIEQIEALIGLVEWETRISR